MHVHLLLILLSKKPHHACCLLIRCDMPQHVQHNMEQLRQKRALMHKSFVLSRLSPRYS